MSDKALVENRRARHDYTVLETIEAGIALTGTETKSIRKGQANLQDAYVRIVDGEAFIWNMHVSPFEQGNRYNVEPTRTRKLLLHKTEIKKLFDQVRLEGNTLIPLKLYIAGGYCKVLVGLCKGKKNYDKRRAEAERSAKREMERAKKGAR